MRALAINGSPRRDQNTAKLLQAALDGTASEGAETEIVHLYDLRFKGCISCFSCKRKDRPHGHCALRDDLTAILEKAYDADILILGSPLYYMNITSGMAAFLERLLYPNTIYSRETPTVYPSRKAVGFLYTMNMKQEQMEPFGIPSNLRAYQNSLETIFREKLEVLYACNTYQFSDYSRYESSMFSEPEKAAYREIQFPRDLDAAFSMGKALAGKQNR